ncbi:MAG: hypothetical protein PVG79_02675 [Gemmatimonadales bacterium]|jgi:hypothetical protein
MSPQSNVKSPSQLVAEVLLRNNVLTREQLQAAVTQARQKSCGLTYTLVSMGLVQETVLLRLLSQIFKVRAVELSKIERIDPSVLETVSAEIAGRGLVLPVHRSADTLTVAMVNPTNRATIARLSQVTGLKIQPVIATEFALRSAIPKHYKADRPAAAAGPAANAPPPQPQAQPQPRPQPTGRQPSGKLRMQTRARNAPRRPAPAPAAPTPAARPTAEPPAPPARPPTPAAVAAPVIPSPADEVPSAQAPNPDPAAHAPGEQPDPDELLRKQMEAEVALANMSFRGEDTGDEGSGGKLMLIGVAMIIGGGIMTWMSYNAAGEGGSYVVTTGLFIGGAAILFRGLLADWSP